MKKIIILATMIVAAIAANAASFNWSAINIYGSSLTDKYSGDVVLHCAQLADWSVTATASNGTIAKTATEFSDAKFVAGTDYDFFFTIEDNGKIFTSATKSVGAQASDVAGIAFGNQATATQSAGNWAAVPEPTSGLLLLLGLAGLAL